MTHRLNVCSPARGHATLTYEPTDAMATEQVREEFDALVAAGYLGFKDGEPTQTFDPTAEEMLVTPLIVAG